MSVADALGWITGQQSDSQDHRVTFTDAYPAAFEGLVSGSVAGQLSGEATPVPFITVTRDSDGATRGAWGHVDGDAADYRVDVVFITDAEYVQGSVTPDPDGSWESTGPYDPGDAWLQANLVTVSTGVVTAFSGPPPDAAPNVEMRLYARTDVDYQIASTHVGSLGGFHFGMVRAGVGASLVARLVVTATGRFINSTEYATAAGFQGLVRSFWIPQDDPAYGYEGGSERTTGYRLEQRSWIYDDALAVFALTAGGMRQKAADVLTALTALQHEDGSLPFSADVFLGQIFEEYVRAGAVAWVGMAGLYYERRTRDVSFHQLIINAAGYLLTLQVTDPTSGQHGSFRGGRGHYDEDYNYVDDAVTWASTEHTIDCYFFLRDLGAHTGDVAYTNAAALAKNSLLTHHWNASEQRFNQGVGDTAEALDCATWGGLLCHSLDDAWRRGKCVEFMGAFRVDGLSMDLSDDGDAYNQTYSHPGPLGGWKPYNDGYTSPPVTLWAEGSMGAILLRSRVGADTTADLASIEAMQSVDPRGGIAQVTAGAAALPYEFHVWPAVAATAWYATFCLDPDALLPAPIRPCVVVKAATIYDDFSLGLGAGWVVGEGAPDASAGRLAMPTEAGSPVEVHWGCPLDLTSSYVFARVDPSVADNTHYRMLLSGSGGEVGFVVVGPNPSALRLRLKQSDVVALADTFTDHDPVAHAWWRIREAAGALLWDTSPNGRVWTNRRVARHTMDLTSVVLSFQVGADTLAAGFGKALFGIGGSGVGQTLGLGTFGSGTFGGGAYGFGG